MGLFLAKEQNTEPIGILGLTLMAELKVGETTARRSNRRLRFWRLGRDACGGGISINILIDGVSWSI